MLSFNHPDFHFSFPIHLLKSEKSEISADHRSSFVEMIKEYHCIGKQTWYAKMGNENKQGVIGVKESQEIIKRLPSIDGMAVDADADGVAEASADVGIHGTCTGCWCKA